MRLTRLLMSNEFKYFKRYIDREMYSGGYRRRKFLPVLGWKEMQKRDWYYSEHRPWTEDFKKENAPGMKHPLVIIQPIEKWTIFKGDRVELLVGKDKGKQGIVNCIIKERNWCFVEGLNCEYKNLQQSPTMPPTCQKDERPLLVTTQVKLVDPTDERGTDVEWRYTEDGKQVRVSTRSGRIIPIPAEASALEDHVLPAAYAEGPKDTTEKQLTEVTFKPRLVTFEEDIMEQMGIKEDRKPGKTYWY